MSTGRRATSSMALASVLSLAAGCELERDTSDRRPRLALEPCHVDGIPRQALCGTHEVYEDRDAGTGRRIELRIVVLPAWGRNARPDPVFLLAGGPGQAASEAFPPLLPFLKDVARSHDVVMVDQRGTGSSAPLDCDLGNRTLAQKLSDRYEPKLVESCRDALDADLDLYTTPLAVDDLDEVRDALGYDRVNLIGGSYGTRVALSYLRRHPDKVRAAVLDGVAPTTMVLPLGFARDAERALGLLHAACAADAGCRRAFPEPRRDLEGLLDRLSRAPARVSLPHPRSGELVDVTVTRDVFTSSLRGLLYSTETSALLPLMVEQAVAGDFAPFVAQATLLSDALEETMSLGLFLSVICAEDVPRITDEDLLRETKDTLFGDRAVSVLREACGLWPRGRAPDGYADPVVSDAPVVVLSGELDPVTPPRWGESVVRHLGRGRHVVVPGTAHGTLANRCVPGLVAAFLEEGDVDGLDLGCIDELVRPPFFIDFAGPEE